MQKFFLKGLYFSENRLYCHYGMFNEKEIQVIMTKNESLKMMKMTDYCEKHHSERATATEESKTCHYEERSDVVISIHRLAIAAK